MRLKQGILGVAVVMMFVACTGQAGNRQPPPPVDTKKNEPADVRHQVSQGETLAQIANWYTGRSSNWTLIREANPGLRPERMNLGQTIIIPGHLVIQSAPMPRRTGRNPNPGKPPVEEQNPTSLDVEPIGDPIPVPKATPVVDENEVNLDLLLKQQIEETEKARVAPPSPSEMPPPPGEVATPRVDETRGEKPQATPEVKPVGDEEREKLLDELLK